MLQGFREAHLLFVKAKSTSEKKLPLVFNQSRYERIILDVIYLVLSAVFFNEGAIS